MPDSTSDTSHQVHLAVVQMACAEDQATNLDTAERLVRQAAEEGAQIVLLPELFAGRYFPQVERDAFFETAHEVDGHPFLGRFARLAEELQVVLPISFFERANQAYYNSLATIDADGTVLGIYRKSHIPDGPGYEEKYYFVPGEGGFVVWDTRVARIGVGICWDQWFPEAARIMMLQGADLLLYPTAIGSEPAETGGLDTRHMWRRAMVGHAVSNVTYVAAANRVGVEGDAYFYGTSFVADPTGEVIAGADDTSEATVHATLDLRDARAMRAGFGFFRDRRPDLYGPLLTMDGRSRVPHQPEKT